LAYQPPANNIFLSEQTSHQQPANSTFLSEQTSTSQTNRLVYTCGFVAAGGWFGGPTKEKKLELIPWSDGRDW
jgi:hypothetical protein